MGGLLTKYILTNEANDNLRAATRACVFFSVPHFGAELGEFFLHQIFYIHAMTSASSSILWYSSCLLRPANG